jgi:hypothetical protein
MRKSFFKKFQRPLLSLISESSYRECGRDSVVGTANRYGLDDSGIEFRTRGPPRLLYNGPRAIPGGKGGVAWRESAPHSAEVKERMEPHIYSPSVPSWQVTERNLPAP